MSCRGWRCGRARRRSPASSDPARRCCEREVDARAGEAGAEEEEEKAAAVAERWKADLERFHHDGITGARDDRLAVGVGLMASEAERR